LGKFDKSRHSFLVLCHVAGLNADIVKSRLDSSGEMTASQICYHVRRVDIETVVKVLEELEYPARNPYDIFPECTSPSKLPYVYPRIAISAVQGRLGKR
jgi:hypothetical protein